MYGKAEVLRVLRHAESEAAVRNCSTLNRACRKRKMKSPDAPECPKYRQMANLWCSSAAAAKNFVPSLKVTASGPANKHDPTIA